MSSASLRNHGLLVWMQQQNLGWLKYATDKILFWDKLSTRFFFNGILFSFLQRTA